MRTRNAIILATGKSTRFASFTYVRSWAVLDNDKANR